MTQGCLDNCEVVGHQLMLIYTHFLSQNHALLPKQHQTIACNNGWVAGCSRGPSRDYGRDPGPGAKSLNFAGGSSFEDEELRSARLAPSRDCKNLIMAWLQPPGCNSSGWTSRSVLVELGRGEIATTSDQNGTKNEMISFDLSVLKTLHVAHCWKKRSVILVSASISADRNHKNQQNCQMLNIRLKISIT